MKGDIEIFKAWPLFKNVDAFIDTAQSIEGLPFACLEYVLQWKRYLGREKDLKDIK